MKLTQKIGLVVFILSLGVFVGSLSMSNYNLTEAIVQEKFDSDGRKEAFLAVADDMVGKEYTSKFGFLGDMETNINEANDWVIERYGLTADEANAIVDALPTPGKYDLSVLDQVIPGTDEVAEGKKQALRDNTSWMQDKTDYADNEAIRNDLQNKVKDINNSVLSQRGFDPGKLKELKYTITKASSTGFLTDQLGLLFIISFVFTCLGGLLYIIPLFYDGPAGIKHHGIYHSSATNRGALAIVVAVFLIGFYVLLYWFPYLITNWVLLVDPVSEFLTGHEASQWFLYGFMYCLAMIVMAVRMFAKYRNNMYQMVRTGSVLVFQVGFAFLIPNIMEGLNNPWYVARDFKNIWPLDYTFFFEWNVGKLAAEGTLGWWIIGWSIALIVVVVPLMTFFFGKRWYCSWVCGCGGLAETLGDPYRQHSDKSIRAWKVERWLIHFVLFFATAMTLATVYPYFAESGADTFWTKTNFILLISGIFLLIIGILWGFRKSWKHASNRMLLAITAGLGIIMLIINYNHFTGNPNLMWMSHYTVQGWYGFLIGAAFAGIVGTGFYPVMGNRVWCRFGCPLAAYFGLVQRLRSRFRITTNGGQCISCGNCSTYCEMGIDVRSYAQKGQNIVRSSCVGCGVCSAVCPRGVLKLENGPDNEGRIVDNPIIIGNDGIRLNPATMEDDEEQRA